MSETINFINKLNESALTSDEPISDETKRFVKGISKEDHDAGKPFSIDDFNKFKKMLKANGLSKFTDKQYSELFDYYFKCYNNIDEAMKNLQKSKIIKENNLRSKKSLKTESKFDKVQATLPLDNFHSMGIIVSDDGETVQYMYSNDENSIYESEIEYDEEGNPYFKDENDNTWYLNEFMRTDWPDNEDDLEESKELKESDESILRLAKKSIVNGKLPEEIKYKGKTYKQFYVMDSENSGETSDIYYCNMENTPSGDPQESNDYFYLKVALNKTENGYKGIKEIRFAEDLTESKELKESVISDMKKKGLYDYIVNEYYNMDKDKLADIAKEAVYILYNEDKDLIKTYKENLKEYTDIDDDIIEAADGHYMDYLSAHYSELSKNDLKDFAKEALALIMDNNLVDEYIKDLKNNTLWANDEEDDLKEDWNNNHKIKIGSKVYWVGVGNEISAEGEVIDFPVDGRMTIKWDDNEQNTYDVTHPNIILADNYDDSVNESENKIDPNNLTTDQLSKLRKDITLNSTFTDDYENSLGIDSQLVQNFFDGYIEYLSEMIREDIGEDKYDELDDNDWYNYINEYDTLENLEHYYNAVRVID